jgi:SAM-dependent methyltransferase
MRIPRAARVLWDGLRSAARATGLQRAVTLPADAFRRFDETPDSFFYRQPRFVEHIDDAAIAAVTQLYRELFPADGAILDVMSSWVSHLPSEIAYRNVVGLGMNQAELEANPRLHAWVVHDLNHQPRLPFDDDEFDAAAICVSIQYLTRPVEVLRDLGRVLKANSPLAITFSNRCFPTKAVAIWQSLDDVGHAHLIRRYLENAGTWQSIEASERTSEIGDPLFAVVARVAQ